jgi:sortase (surface protein transpeptidase)
MRPLRHAARSAAYASRPAPEPARKLFQDVAAVQGFEFPADLTKLSPTPALAVPQAAVAPPQRQTFPATPHKPEPSRVLMREAFKPAAPSFARDIEPIFKTVTPRPELHRTFDPPPKAKRITLPKLRVSPKAVVFKIQRGVRSMSVQQRALTGLASFVFVAGVGISLVQFHANQLGKLGAAQASVAGAIAATTTNSDSTAPSTAPITADTLRSYHVAPDAARYIRIGKLGVLARVLQVGTTKSGALATPNNVFDAAWYKDSAKPGEPGATLIDGHVSSWTTNGVFYGIKGLAAGDNIEIERGDGKQLEYTVVKTVTYPVDSVDMTSLMKPVTAGKSGLNLITCGGKYDSKSGEFTQRIAVYASLND